MISMLCYHTITIPRSALTALILISTQFNPYFNPILLLFQSHLSHHQSYVAVTAKRCTNPPLHPYPQRFARTRNLHAVLSTSQPFPIRS